MIQYIKLDKRAISLEKKSKESIGYDLRAMRKFSLWANQRKQVNTGIAIKFPEGYRGRVVIKKELAYRHGLTVIEGEASSTDEDEIKFTVANLGDKPIDVQDGEVIAELIIEKYYEAEFHQVEEFI
jgi:dUTP pyrophosphatase|tara:strand:+ start:1131 stop:1508 length:378 start_codon:yes stop_codon:yes gene_type:complete